MQLVIPLQGGYCLLVDLNDAVTSAIVVRLADDHATGAWQGSVVTKPSTLKGISDQEHREKVKVALQAAAAHADVPTLPDDYILGVSHPSDGMSDDDEETCTISISRRQV
jgi:hypothetical protein